MKKLPLRKQVSYFLLKPSAHQMQTLPTDPLCLFSNTAQISGPALPPVWLLLWFSLCRQGQVWLGFVQSTVLLSHTSELMLFLPQWDSICLSKSLQDSRDRQHVTITSVTLVAGTKMWFQWSQLLWFCNQFIYFKFKSWQK